MQVRVNRRTLVNEIKKNQNHREGLGPGQMQEAMPVDIPAEGQRLEHGV